MTTTRSVLSAVASGVLGIIIGFQTGRQPAEVPPLNIQQQGVATLPTWQPPKKTVIVMHCVDGRYHLPENLNTLPTGNFYVTCAGCAKLFVEDPSTRESFYHQLELLRHEGVNVEEVDFVDHLTCKAYGSHDSAEEHEANLHIAYEKIRDDPRSKNIAVHLFVHDMKNKKLTPVPHPDI